MTQREDSNGLAGTNGCRFSGGPIHAFRKGWAIDIWAFGRAHHWLRITENIGYVESACGLIRPAKSMYGVGDTARCKRCERAMKGAEVS